MPSNLYNPLHSPHWAAAASNLIDRRLSHGGGSTGWSAAWLMAGSARLFDGEAAAAIFYDKLLSSVAPRRRLPPSPRPRHGPLFPQWNCSTGRS